MEKYPDRLSDADLDKIFESQQSYEKFMIDHLIEPTDSLTIRETETPLGIKKEYIAVRPNGKWRKQTFIFQHEGLEIDPSAFIKEQTICAYKWMLSGKRLEDWELCNPDNLNQILEDIKNLSEEDMARARAEHRRDDLIFNKSSN
jgi:hypothetical protein